MDTKTCERLIALNLQFYQTFAVQFSATRQRLQPGVRRILEQGLLCGWVLDLGCGNGELARTLGKMGFAGAYTGLDFSPALLDEARRDLPPTLKAAFRPADLTCAAWAEELPAASWDAITAFAVLHHIPGEARRLEILAAIRRLLAPQGVFIHSNWQFLNSPRLAQRIQPWDKAGLDAAQVDTDDYLLDWRGGGSGLRYVHHFSLAELSRLADKSGFSIETSFASDGESGNLGLYQVWRSAD